MKKTLGEDAVAARERAANPQQGHHVGGPTSTDPTLRDSASRFAWTHGLDEAQIEHVCRQLGDSLSSNVSTGPSALTGPELVEVANVVSRLRRTGNVHGVDGWIAFEESQTGSSAHGESGQGSSSFRMR